MERKIQVSQTRILEFGLKYLDKTYISFSGGKDSTVLLDLVRRVFPDTPAVFIDTGLEYPEVRKFAMSTPNVTVIKPAMTFRQVIEKYGYPLTTKRIAGYVNTARRNPNSTRAQYLRGEKFSTMFGFGNGKFNFLVDAPFEISDYCCDVMKNGQRICTLRKPGDIRFLERWRVNQFTVKMSGRRMAAILLTGASQCANRYRFGQSRMFLSIFKGSD